MTAAARHSETAAPPVPDVADDLADMLRSGRVCGPTAVVRVEYVLADGRRVGADLPAPAVTADDPDSEDVTAGGPLSDLAREILDALGQTPDDWNFGEEVCRRIGGGTTIGRSFYRAVAELKAAGRIESNPRKGLRLKS
jgi:hypothetical protein